MSDLVLRLESNCDCSMPLHELPADLIGVTQIACPHFRIAENPNQLSIRTLLRGAGLRLAPGQSAASPLGETVLTEQELTQNSNGESTEQGRILSRTGLAHETSLWYYILKESEVRNNGNRLVPLGGKHCFLANFGFDSP